MNIWSPDSLQLSFGRKVVPEGSNDFQRVLDEILCSEYGGDKSDNGHEGGQLKDINFVYHGDYKCRHDDDYHQPSDTHVVNDSLTNENLLLQTNNSDNNNNITSPLTCTLDKCQEHYHLSENNTECSICLSNISFSHCFKRSLTDIEAENNKDTNSFTFLDTEHQVLKMGTSCSSNFYDNREWHSVKGDSNIDIIKPKKRGRLLKRFTSNDKTSAKSQVPSSACKCVQENIISESEQPSCPVEFQANGIKSTPEKCASLSPDDIPQTNSMQLTSNRLSPNVDSSGHVQLSRVVGSGRARATTECDVSPHRLLTRRNNSPNGQACGLDARSASATYYEERQRSNSWSNGKFGAKANFKTSSLIVRQPLTNPVRNQKTNSPQTLTDRASKAPTTSLATVSKFLFKPSKVEAHDPECPLHIRPEEVPTISISKSQVTRHSDSDSDMAPISRRRAASESQTMRPRKLLTRTPDSSDNIQEHVHVRWADEEKGSSLSTSVFLSSIRPRSYSYGAMDNMPQRPILKKVAGF